MSIFIDGPQASNIPLQRELLLLDRVDFEDTAFIEAVARDY